MNSPILVTGGAGYIGSHTCKALAAAGYTPVTYDNFVTGHERAVRWGPLEKGDVQDRSRLSEVMTIHRPAAVIHFAGLAYVGESVTDPAKYYRNNVTGTLTLLDAMRAQGIRQIVFSSTCATYGIPDKVPISEDAAQRPISPYGASKLMVERILADFGAAYNISSIALRYFNAAGADPEGEIGEDHRPETHVIPLILEAATGARPYVTIFGNDYDTPDGTCIRDYVHVSDLANAHLLALRKLDGGDVRCAYNLGSGEGTSVAELVDKARQITKRKINVVIGRRRAGDPGRLTADPVRARNDLGWVPQHSATVDIMESAWSWCLRSGRSPLRRVRDGRKKPAAVVLSQQQKPLATGVDRE